MKNTLYLLFILLIVSVKTFAQLNTIDKFGKINNSVTTKIEILKKNDNDTIITDISSIELKPSQINRSSNQNIALKKIYPPLKKIAPTSKYGYRIHPITKALKFHTGIDLKAWYEPVYNITDGIVTSSGYGNVEGNYVMINHGKVSSVYCHLSKIVCSKGQVIKAGEVIGVSGNSGRSTGPHLHFGVRYENQKLNPKSLLRLLK